MRVVLFNLCAMTNTSQYKFIGTELDRNFLATPFAVRTNWHVITGAPCSGKTTLVDMLARRGFRTIPESARILIKNEIASGKTMRSLRSDSVTLQLGIETMQLKVESELAPEEPLLLDEAYPGSLAWHRVYGLDPNEILPHCFLRRYATVFILDRLPFRIDEERVEEMDAVACFLDGWYVRDYTSLGYPVIKVPVLAPEERLEYVLDKLPNSI
jgi:predicted ATPase